MITAKTAPRQITRWQRELAQAITDPAELLRELRLDPALLPAARAAAARFPLRVPRGFVARMMKGDPADPLLRQVLPLAAELTATPGFVADPVGDGEARAAPGVLHKYHGRALLIVTGALVVRLVETRTIVTGGGVTGIEVLVPRTRIAAVLAAVANDAALSIVPASIPLGG